MNGEKIWGQTPNGGDYSLVFYVDDNGISVNPNEATKIIIQEYTKDDKMIQETIGFVRRQFGR